MSTKHLHELTSRLDRIFEISMGITDDEVKSHYARYLCVLTSGYIEESMKNIIRDYAANKASQCIVNHVNSSIKNITSLKTENIGAFLNTFNSEWKEKFEKNITDQEKDSLDSVIANRHQIAHGHNVGVSFVRVKDWYKDIKIVINKVSKIVNS